MHNQPRYKPLQPSRLWADGRSARPLLEGTVARGHLVQADRAFYLGRRAGTTTGTGNSLGGNASGASSNTATGVSAQVAGAAGSGAAGMGAAGAVQTASAGRGSQAGAQTPGSAGGADSYDPTYVTEFPYPVTREMVERGRLRYNIFCSPCHGFSGHGNGMIVQRGLSAPPTFHSDKLREAPVGHFFDVITNGYGAMYSYGARVNVSDRWAIISYLRALQLSQNAAPGDVPPDQLTRLQPAQGQQVPAVPEDPDTGDARKMRKYNIDPTNMGKRNAEREKVE